MADYRLYSMTRDGHIKGFVEVSANNDIDAMVASAEHYAMDDLELWNGGRFVHLFSSIGTCNHTPTDNATYRGATACAPERNESARNSE